MVVGTEVNTPTIDNGEAVDAPGGVGKTPSCRKCSVNREEPALSISCGWGVYVEQPNRRTAKAMQVVGSSRRRYFAHDTTDFLP